MIYLKTDEEIELLRESNLLVGQTLGELAKWVAPGVTTLQLDRIAEEFIRDHQAVPGFLGYAGYPNTLCVSVNEQIWYTFRLYVEGGRYRIDRLRRRKKRVQWRFGLHVRSRRSSL